MATAALNFILDASPAARAGMMKLLRGVIPQLPSLWFSSQQSEGPSRPDMCGYDESGAAHVLVENKFWAGFTENQPVEYIRRLATAGTPSVLLVIVPENRAVSVWHELSRRVIAAGATLDEQTASGVVVRLARSSFGPLLAVTTWTRALSFLEAEVGDEPAARSDLMQLRALCEQADEAAFQPFAAEEISSQRIPAMLLQLNSLVQDCLAHAFALGVLHRGDLRPQADGTRTGRYAIFFPDHRAGVWFGVHLSLWRKHGRSPIWAVFPNTDWGRAFEVKALLEPWAARDDILVATESDGSFAVSFAFRAGEEKDAIVQSIAARLKEIQQALAPLPARRLPSASAPELLPA